MGDAPLAAPSSMLMGLLIEAVGTTHNRSPRLKDVRIFRSEHQRGGGTTAAATYINHDDRELPAIVKFPVGSAELSWTVQLSKLQEDDPRPVTPQVLASGRSLGDGLIDIGWVVMERLPHGPVAYEPTSANLKGMLRAAARLEELARRVMPPEKAPPPRQIDFARLMERSREVIKRGTVVSGTEAQRWNNTLKEVHRVLPTLLRHWDARPINAWCHGDLHAGNAMFRHDKTIVLIDLALMQPGHWTEDALYLERTTWSRPDLLAGVHPVTELALHRRELALETDGDYGRLACIRRVLAASCAPALIEREGNTGYLRAAFEIIHKNLAMAAH